MKWEPLCSWPWYFRLPVGLLVGIPLLFIAVLLESVWKALVSFFDREQWTLLLIACLAAILGDGSCDDKEVPQRSASWSDRKIPR